MIGVSSLPSFALLDEVEAGILILDGEHRVRHWNKCMERFSGLASGDVLDRPLWESFPALKHSLLRTAVEDALASGAPGVLSHTLHPSLFPLRCKDGRPMLHDVLVRQLSLEGGPYCLLQVKDATERRHAQETLGRSRARYRAAFENAAIGICEVAPLGHFLRINDRLCAILGYTREELLARRIQDITYAEDLGPNLAALQSLFAGTLPSFTMEKRYVRKDGSLVWCNVTCSAVLSAENAPVLAIGTVEDISRRKQAEAEREQLLEQKDLLMREVHHRVKNSLSMVASLLLIQNRQIADAAARGHLADAYRRVLAIAQVHERLYQGSRVDRLEFRSFLHDLCADLERSVVALERGQQVIASVDADIELPFEKALPLAIIISELISNAFKHAKPDGSPGKVTVACTRSPTGLLQLTVTDDGVGLPDGFDPAESRGLGMRIVAGLSQQLRANLEAGNSGAGARFTLHVEP
jgi:PAS domain S-box-containing protein